MDTAESEEDSCAWSLVQSSLLPPTGACRAGRMARHPRFGLHVSGAVFGGWVKQSSPACAAAKKPARGTPWRAAGGADLALRRRMTSCATCVTYSSRPSPASARVSNVSSARPSPISKRHARPRVRGCRKDPRRRDKAVPGLKSVEAMRLAIALAKFRGEPELDAEAARATNDCRDVVDEKNTPPNVLRRHRRPRPRGRA